MDQANTPTPAPEQAAPAAENTAVEELLVEEISIDGMCGVY
jgi:mycofactocin precursor